MKPDNRKFKYKKQTPARHHRKPPLSLQLTTLWDYPSQHYGDSIQGDPNYVGATPSYIIWNLLNRYTREGDVVIDPCCGSGTTLDVCKDLDRVGLGFDVNPTRDDIKYCDARRLSVESESADFVFIDPPYSTHIDYSDDPNCLGKLSASSGEYYKAMQRVIKEIYRVLKPGKFMALYVSDSLVKAKRFEPIGFELFSQMREYFTPIDIISVVRHNKSLEMGNYRKAAEEQNFFLRGFNYLFIMQKPARPRPQKTNYRNKTKQISRNDRASENFSPRTQKRTSRSAAAKNRSRNRDSRKNS